jgi:hypothetical protein
MKHPRQKLKTPSRNAAPANIAINTAKVIPLSSAKPPTVAGKVMMNPHKAANCFGGPGVSFLGSFQVINSARAPWRDILAPPRNLYLRKY